MSTCRLVPSEGCQQSEILVIFRTIGVQAVFDILRKLAANAYEDRNISVQYFTEKIAAAKEIDFAAEKFRNPSGSGRTLIRKTIEDAIGIDA